MTSEEKDLVIATVDGSLPSGEEERLQELLKRDEQAMKMYAREALLHGELEWHYGVCRQSSIAQSRQAEVAHELRRHDREKSKIVHLVWKIAACIVISAALLWQFAPRAGQDAASIASIEEAGKGFEVHRGQAVIATEKGMALQSGDRIVSSQPDQRLSIHFTDGSTVSINDAGSIRLEELRNKKGKLIHLESGKAHFKVSKQENPFQVATQHGTVTVVGTIFDVATNVSSMTLDVSEGAVDFNNTMNHQIMVRAGEQVIASKDNPRIRRTITLVATDSRLFEIIPRSPFVSHRTEHVSASPTVRNKSRSLFLLQFDLSSIPENIRHASLKLYCTKSEAQPGMITMHVEQFRINKQENEKIPLSGQPGSREPILASWSPEPESYNTIDLSDDILPELGKQTNFNLRFTSTANSPTTEQSAVIFASSRHPDKEKRPVLILEIED